MITPGSGAQFAAFLEAMPGAIIGVDGEGAILQVNARAGSLFGYERDELIGKPMELLVPVSTGEGGRSEGMPTLPDPLGQPVGGVMHVAARRKDGSEFPAEISLGLSILDGRLITSAAIRDVTWRTQAEVKFQGVAEGAADAAVGVDPRGRIALVNTEAEDLFGYTRAELIDQPVDLLVPQAVPDVPAHHGSRHVGVGGNVQTGTGAPLAGRRKDGSEFPAEISLSAIATREGPLVNVAFRDASDRAETRREHERSNAQAKRDLLESQLHQSHRFESLGQLAAGVAHDFNSLLSAILHYVRFVSEDIGREIEARPVGDRARLAAVLSDVGQIGATADRAAKLTHQLLAFARRDARSLEVLDINAVVSEVETLLRRTIGDHVVLITQGASDLNGVRADRGQTEQVLLNLAVNARDAMPNGGTLTIGTENFTVDPEYAELHPGLRVGPHVRLRVTDTGIGMDRDTVDRAFEPLFSTKPSDEGTGLGLSTVYGIVTQAAGTVDLRSDVGLGTTVTILLPAVAAAE